MNITTKWIQRNFLIISCAAIPVFWNNMIKKQSPQTVSFIKFNKIRISLNEIANPDPLTIKIYKLTIHWAVEDSGVYNWQVHRS